VQTEKINPRSARPKVGWL